MAVTYLSGGENITAEKLNLLFDAFDALVGKVLDNRSPYLWSGFASRHFIAHPFQSLGIPFCFTNGNSWKVKGGVSVVDGSNAYFLLPTTTYNPAALITEINNAAVQYLTNGYAVVDPLPTYLDSSLQILKKRHSDGNDYPVAVHPAGGVPIYDQAQRYGLAELVVENGVDTFEISATWDRFYYFRVHNLNDAPLTVTCGTVSKVIPKDECWCFHRDGSTQRRYFPKHKSGDPRLLYTTTADARTFRNSHQSNPVANPFGVIHRVLTDFDAQGRVLIDRSKVCDIAPLYEGIFKAIKSGVVDMNAVIGDLLIHKGKMLLAHMTDGTKQEVEFDGASDFADKMVAAGCALSTAGGIQTLSKSLNYFFGIESNAGFTSGISPITPGTLTLGATLQGKRIYGCTRASVANAPYANINRLSIATGTPQEALRIQAESIAGALALRWTRPAGYSGWQTTGTAIKLTPRGPVISGWNEIAPTCELAIAGLLPSSVFTRSAGLQIAAGGKLVNPFTIEFKEVGWPDYYGTEPLGLYPRFVRQYGTGTSRDLLGVDSGTRRYNFPVVEWSNDDHAPDAAALSVSNLGDVVNGKVKMLRRVKTLAFQSFTWDERFGGFARDAQRSTFARVEKPDLLEEVVRKKDAGFLTEIWPRQSFTNDLWPIGNYYFHETAEVAEFIRIPLAVEYYNAMAEMINSVTHYQPLGWYDAWIKAGATVYPCRRQGPTVAPLWSLEAGYTSFGALPNDCYAAFIDAKPAAFYAAIGIALQTKANFPAPFADMEASNHELIYVDDNSIEVTGENWLQKTMSASYAGYASAFRWVKVADVAAKAAALGYKFTFQECVRPVELTKIKVVSLSRITGIPGHTSIPRVTWSIIERGGSGEWKAENPTGIFQCFAGFAKQLKRIVSTANVDRWYQIEIEDWIQTGSTSQGNPILERWMTDAQFMTAVNYHLASVVSNGAGSGLFYSRDAAFPSIGNFSYYYLNVTRNNLTPTNQGRRIYYMIDTGALTMIPPPASAVLSCEMTPSDYLRKSAGYKPPGLLQDAFRINRWSDYAPNGCKALLVPVPKIDFTSNEPIGPDGIPLNIQNAPNEQIEPFGAPSTIDCAGETTTITYSGPDARQVLVMLDPWREV